MPELPDVVVYVEALQRRLVDQRLDRVQIPSPFLLRTFDPPLESLVGQCPRRVGRVGKRIAIEFDNGGFLTIHFMIAGRFPAPREITAFRPEFAVHGKFGKPCPVCGHLVQRIRYAENETNYCPVCQTGSRVLADRSLSRLLKDDWPRTVAEWEQERQGP